MMAEVLGGISPYGVGNLVFIDGDMTGEMYRAIFDNNLLQSVNKLGMGAQWIFQHDNDPKHTAGIVTNWLNSNGIQRLKWPPFLPDLTPIEHLWDEIERRMKKEQPKNEKDLKECLTRVWKDIQITVLNDSVPNRLNEVIRMKGYPTKY